jgi:hypothetical protein
VLSVAGTDNRNIAEKRMRTIVLTIALVTGLASQGYAGASYSLPAGTTDAGNNPVSATAILSLSLVGSQEVLTVTLENFAADQISDGENITGIKLSINSSQITGVTLASSTADLIQVPNKTSITDLGIGSLSHWTATTSLSELTLTTIGGRAPTQAIIGAPASGGDYSNANGSLTGRTKQPYSNQAATFTLDLTGSNISMSSITGVDIGFGTEGTNYIDPPLTATAEPGTLWLLGASAVLIGLGSQRKRFKKVNPRSTALLVR